MIPYIIVFYVVGFLFLVLGIMIWRGNTKLIHAYHQKNVTDFKGYGKAIGKVVAGIGALACFAASSAFLGERWTGVGIWIFFIGLCVLFIVMYFIQKKYNGSLFSKPR